MKEHGGSPYEGQSFHGLETMCKRFFFFLLFPLKNNDYIFQTSFLSLEFCRASYGTDYFNSALFFQSVTLKGENRKFKKICKNALKSYSFY
jgi:hypothetical protein